MCLLYCSALVVACVKLLVAALHNRVAELTTHRCRYGVGGEYPMAAGSAAERAETGGIQKARFRGREVVLTFSMQVALTTLRRELCALPRLCCGCRYAPSRRLRVLQPVSVDICLGPTTKPVQVTGVRISTG